MLLTRLFFAAALAAALDLGGRVAAYPLTITLPPSTAAAPPVSVGSSPLLVGVWHDKSHWRDSSHLHLPPGVTLFEVALDTLSFRADGTFVQDIEKATGTLHIQGHYAVTGSRLTLDYLFDSRKPAQYEFVRTGDSLLLQPVGLGKLAAWTLQRIGARE